MTTYELGLRRADFIVQRTEELIEAWHDYEAVPLAPQLAALEQARTNLAYAHAHEQIPDPDAPVDTSVTTSFTCGAVGAGVVPAGIMIGNGHCVWYTHDGNGEEPDLGGWRSIPVPLSPGALTAAEHATQLAASIDGDPYLNAQVDPVDDTQVNIEGADSIS